MSPMEIDLILIDTLNIFTAFSMFGLIWLIQLVHYPSFHYVADEEFVAFESFHSRTISLIVIPLMLVELISACILVFLLDFAFLSLFELGLVISAWVSTAVFSVPCHAKLSKEKDSQVIHRLVRTNWIRTSLWTLRAVIILWKLTQ